jgi:4-hydroxy-2-oxoglutarate aldolase
MSLIKETMPYHGLKEEWELFKGIYTPIVTPFNELEEIDYSKMAYNLDRWGQTGLDGIVVLGTNGEFVYLTTEEKVELINFAVKNFNPDKKVIAGTGCETTRDTIALCLEAAEAGAHAVLVLPPHYYRGLMNEEVLYSHYIEVADNSPVPVLIYNMPKNTGINLSVGLVGRLSQHPNIVGIKDTAGNIVQLAELVRDTTEGFSVFAGNAGYLLPALSVGAKGATVATGNILPEMCCKVVDLFNAGKMEEAKALQQRLLEPNSLVTAKYGIPALKSAMDMLGYQGGLPRRPLKPLTLKEKEIVRAALVRCGALQG